jgi:hypothetical protein
MYCIFLSIGLLFKRYNFMKKLLFTIAFIYLILAAHGQNALAIKYAELITPELAKQHLSVIASDAYEGRETGMPGADKAANYIANKFKSLGLQPIVNGSYFFNVPLVQKQTNITLTANGDAFVSGVDLYDYGHAADGTTTAGEVLFVGYGSESEIKDANLTGKVLVWIDEDKPKDGAAGNTGSTPTVARIGILKNLLSKKPTFILGINPEIGGLLKRFGTQFKRPTIAIKDNKQAGHAGIMFISSTAADAILKPGGKLSDSLISIASKGNFTAQALKADFKLTVQTDTTSIKAVDVLGYLPGNDPKLKNEVVILSAHYDHLGLLPEGTKGDRVYNGADDNGSGTVAIMEIALALSRAKKEGHGLRRSILFLAAVGEEEGLLGSKYYTDHPVLPLENTIADLNMDMIGRVGTDYAGKPDSGNYVYVIGSAMLSTDLHTISEDANNQYTKLKLDYKYDDLNDPNHFYYRFDSFSFAGHGTPSITYFNGTHADYHQPGDEVAKINFPLLAKRAQLVFYTAWALGNADNRPVINGKK